MNNSFFEFPLNLAILRHASILSAVTHTFVGLLSTLTTVDSKLNLLTGTPVISMLFHLPYCSTELLLNSRLIVFPHIFFCVFPFSLFLFCRFFIITSLKFIVLFLMSVKLFKSSTHHSLSFEISSNNLESPISLLLVL